MRLGRTHYRNHERRLHEGVARFRNILFGSIWVLFGENLRKNFASPLPRIAFKNDEPPWRNLAMIGHPCADGENGFEFGRRGAGAAHVARLDGAAGSQEV